MIGITQSAVADIANQLRAIVEGDVLSEEWQRAMYATDASSYEIMPQVVVLPRNRDDVIKIVKFAHKNRVPLIARGGGSGLAGQAIGAGIILDFTRYMNKILEIDPKKNYVTVQPGLIKSKLDFELRKHGKFLPPDPSTSDYCSIGGMLANNGCGPRTVKYGAMIEYVVSLQVVLYNGDVIETAPIRLDSEEWQRKTSNDTFEASLYRNISALVEQNLQLIKARVPKVRKNSSGYRLERVVEDGFLDLGKLIVSSEGTLGIILEAKLRIVDLPKHRGVALLYFDDFEKCGNAVAHILKHNPSALELIDYKVVNLAKPDYPELSDTVPDYVKAILIVEFDDANIDNIRPTITAIEKELVRELELARFVTTAFKPEEMRKLWDIRKKALPYVYKMREGERRVVTFIEDTVVDPSKLGIYIKKLYEIYDKYGLAGVIYGHAGDGHVHTRPLLDMKDSKDLELMQKIAEEVFTVAKHFNGSITGEHGDGLARTEYIKFLYGIEVFKLFKDVKNFFDPANVLNPGKKVSDSIGLLVKDLRYGPEYRRRKSKTTLNWGITGNKLIQKITGHSDELSYANSVELCHGCGYCREVMYSGRMCPVFKGLGNEVDSCRGRNNLLRWMLKMGGIAQNFEQTTVYRDAIYKHCIQCMMCYVDCPSNVNVGKLMAEARARYATVKGLPKGYKFFINIDDYAELGCKLAPIANYLFRNRTFRTLMEHLTGIDRDRTFPPFARKTFARTFSEYENALGQKEAKKELVFFYDTYINFNRPELGLVLVKIFEKNGYRTIVPSQKSSGLPALVEGAPEMGRLIAEFNLRHLIPYAEKGIPIITFSPSAGITLKMMYQTVLDTREARLVADHTYDVHEFLYGLHREKNLVTDFHPLNKSVYIHLHCHDVVQKVDKEVVALLKLIPGLEVNILERGCCGVGGSYSFIKGNYRPSLEMGKALFDAVRAADREVYSTGESCALQMEAGSGRKVGLTTELLGETYGILPKN